MKIYKNTFLYLFIMVALGACKDESGPTVKDEFIAQIAQTWVIDESSEVILDDVNITDALLGFEITINKDLSYTTNNQDVSLETFPWPSSGSFTVNDDLTQFTRNDGLIIIVLVDKNDHLSMEFQFAEGYDDSTSGRIKGIKGHWKMQFN